MFILKRNRFPKVKVGGSFASGESSRQSVLNKIAFTLVFSCFSVIHSPAQEPLMVYGKFKIDKGDMDGAKIVITKDSDPYKNKATDNSKFEFQLEYEHEYLFTFSKNGYITKRISFDTKVPSARKSEVFEPFAFDVTLFKQYDGVNIIVFNQPVGKIAFNMEKDDFDYDMDYTKSIQAALKAAEAQIEEKRKAEEIAENEARQKAEEMAKATEEAKKKAAEEAKEKAEAKKKADEEARAKAEEEAKKKKEEELAKKNVEAKSAEEAKEKAEAKKRADEEAKIKAEEEAEKKKKEELAKKNVEAKSAEEAKKQAEAKKKADEEAKIKAEEEAKKKKEEELAKKKADALAKTAEEAERKTALASGETAEKEKRQTDARAKTEEEARRQAKQIAEEEARKKTAARTKLFSENYSTSAEPNLPDEKKVEVTEKDNRTITKISIRKTGLLTIYRKVEHQWGAVYYFRGMESITQIVFELGTHDL